MFFSQVSFFSTSIQVVTFLPQFTLSLSWFPQDCLRCFIFRVSYAVTYKFTSAFCNLAWNFNDEFCRYYFLIFTLLAGAQVRYQRSFQSTLHVPSVAILLDVVRSTGMFLNTSLFQLKLKSNLSMAMQDF